MPAFPLTYSVLLLLSHRRFRRHPLLPSDPLHQPLPQRQLLRLALLHQQTQRHPSLRSRQQTPQHPSARLRLRLLLIPSGQ